MRCGSYKLRPSEQVRLAHCVADTLEVQLAELVPLGNQRERISVFGRFVGVLDNM